MIGEKFGRYTIVDGATSTRSGSRRYVCECECGAKRTVPYRDLKNGQAKSCGCYSRELSSARAKTHGKSRTHTYKLWKGMITRCINPNISDYHRYGGRGIKVCDEWRDYAQFLADMGEV